MQRALRSVIGGLVLLLLLFWGAVWLAQAAPSSVAGRALNRVAVLVFGQGAAARLAGGVLPAGVEIGGPFRLTDDHGKPVTDADYRGRWMLVDFGYTTCPDVCPTELQTIATALNKLGPEADQVVPLFITVDPGRDTPAVLADYVKLFDNRLVGLTGTPGQIAAAARAYRVYYAKVTPKGTTTYLMDHSAFLYLMDPRGRFSALFNQSTTADELAAGIQDHLSRKS